MSQHSRSRRALALAVLAALACGALATLPDAAVADERPLVFIDAGHGGPYSNANENGLLEKDVNLMLALELRQRLGGMGFRTQVDRTSDVALCTSDIPTWHEWADGPHLYADGKVGPGTPVDDLQQRVNLANRAGADILVSIHCNGVSDKSVRGVESYGAVGDAMGRRLSVLMQEEVVSEVGVVNRGAKATDFYVVRWANMPAVLIEAGFLSNKLEADRLRSPAYRWRFARAVARGIRRFFDEDPFRELYPRLAGSDRYDTAVAVARAGWPAGASTVLLASGTDFPDALAATPLSKRWDAPLLLTWPGALPAPIRAELGRLRPSRIVVLGSEAAVSATVTAEASAAVAAAGGTAEVVRIGGADRYETAALIAAQVGVPANGGVALVSGTGFPDALSAATYAARDGMPILLAAPSGLPEPSRAFIEANRPAIRQVLVAGSAAAVPDAATVGLPGVTRLAGPDRWTTNAAWLRHWSAAGAVAPFVVNGLDFPDGLVGAAYGAKAGQPLMLAAPRVLPDRAREFIEQNARRITGFTLVGSPETMPTLMDAQLKKARD